MSETGKLGTIKDTDISSLDGEQTVTKERLGHSIFKMVTAGSWAPHRSNLILSLRRASVAQIRCIWRHVATDLSDCPCRPLSAASSVYIVYISGPWAMELLWAITFSWPGRCVPVVYHWKMAPGHMEFMAQWARAGLLAQGGPTHY